MYAEQHLSIKEWAEDDRPREKLMQKGRHTLSDAELMAILISSGNRYETAVDLCKRILSQNSYSLDELAKCTVTDLRKFRGVGEAKAIAIVAAMELGRRRASARKQDMITMDSSEDAYQFIAPTLTDLEHEEFWVLLVNRANKITKKCFISKGGMNSTVVDPKVVFKTALDHGSGGIILCHNHPSGTAKPSEMDLKLTKRLVEGSHILEISLLDHIIVGAKTYFSFADSGLL